MWHFTVCFFFWSFLFSFLPLAFPKFFPPRDKPIWGMQKSTLRQLDPQYILSNQTKRYSNWLAYEYQIWRSFWFWVWLSFPARLIPSWFVRSILGQEIVLRNQTLLFNQWANNPLSFSISIMAKNHSHASIYQKRPYIACFTVLGSFSCNFIVLKKSYYNSLKCKADLISTLDEHQERIRVSSKERPILKSSAEPTIKKNW